MGCKEALYFSEDQRKERPMELMSRNLNKASIERRKTALDEVQRENRRMLSKLQSVKASYDVSKWDNERKELENFLDKRGHKRLPHLFKMDQILKKQKKQKEDLLNYMENASPFRKSIRSMSI
jgi:hypothetical protein